MEKKELRNILMLLSSPRKKSNSTSLAKKIAEGAASQGAAIESVYLHQMSIGPCQACYACQKPDSKGCAIDDDMQSLYPKLLKADSWVIATPVYWFNMSAQTKLFMDRCFAFPAYGKNPFYRKRIAVAMSYGDADPFVSGCINALRCFQDSFRYVGAKIVGMVYGSANEAGEIASNEEVMKAAEELGRKLGKL
ncbi:MAG: flavodoxin family protein [Deltaproteobacteria bacterium]|nr:flavodoxin family protein [Deltaproteobacteria bacterium]MBW1819751.1 flavodoxin family protein [Deltaproteobacteria bacterium]